MRLLPLPLALVAATALGALAIAAPAKVTVALTTPSQDEVLDRAEMIVYAEAKKATKLRVKGSLRPGVVKDRFRLGSKTKTVGKDGAEFGFKLNSKELEALAAAASTCTISRFKFKARDLDSPNGTAVTVRGKLDRRSNC